jgi:hypothetical protein
MPTIYVTQAADGSLTLPGATSVTVAQTATGLTIRASDVIALPADSGAALQVKIDAAKIDLARVVADLV